MSTPLVIGPEEVERIRDLRRRAEVAPLDMEEVINLIETFDGRVAHIARMNAQTIALPTAYTVTYTVEKNHPSGTMRHLSMALEGNEDKSLMPSFDAVWMVAEHFGFHGSVADCFAYPEKLADGGHAVNLVQTFTNG